MKVLPLFFLLVGFSIAQAEHMPTVIATGSDSTCMADSTSVLCQSFQAPTNFVDGFTGIKQLVAGVNHACILHDQGVSCFGANEFKQSEVPYLENVEKIWSDGENTTCAKDSSGIVCWGRLEATYLKHVPAAMKDAQEISIGTDTTCFLKGGVQTCWGSNENHTLDAPLGMKNIRAIGGGDLIRCALAENGIHCWGLNYKGPAFVPDPDQRFFDFKVGERSFCAQNPEGIQCFGDPVLERVPEGLKHPRNLSMGSEHACVLTDDGIRCWGDNQYLQSKWSTALKSPRLISDKGGTSCAVDQEEIKCWGFNRNGQAEAPSKIIPNVKQIVSGNAFSCAFSNDDLQCWGLPSAPPVTKGITALAMATIVVESPACLIAEGKLQCWDIHGKVNVPAILAPVNEVALDDDHACIISDKKVQCWMTESNHPGAPDILTPPSDLINPTNLTTSAFHSCVIDEDQVKCWGDNNYGQFLHPPKLTHPRLVTNGVHFTCAVADEGTRCWGGNEYGEIGVPRGLKNVTSISSGDFETCAIDENGLHCWGSFVESKIPRDF